MSHLDSQIVRLYDTVFDRAPDAGGLEFWNNASHTGLGLRDLASFFISAPEFASTYGEPTNRGFVESMYLNVLDRPGEAEGIAFWTEALDSGRADRPQIVVGFSESAEHVQQMAVPEAPAPAPAPAAEVPAPAPALEAPAPAPVVEAPAPSPAPAPEPVTPPNLDDARRISGDDGPNLLEGTGGVSMIDGWGGDDMIHGGNSDGWLSGGDGRDHIFGGPGNDHIYGGDGSDVLFGGPGADVFRFWASDTGGDYIGDFERGADKIQFADQDLLFRGLLDFIPDGRAQVRYWHDTSGNNKYAGDTIIEMDANGDGAANASIFVHHALLSSGDFLV